VIKRLFEAFDAVNFEAIDELLSPDFVAHGLAAKFSEDAAGWKALAAHWSAGFSDEVLTFDDLIAEDRRVAVRWTSRAVHSGDVFGIAATGRRVTVSGIEIYRLARRTGDRVLGRAAPQRSVRRARAGHPVLDVERLSRRLTLTP
jgi:predicted ester cyclase